MGEWDAALEAFGVSRARLRLLPAGWTNVSVRATGTGADIVLRRHGGLGVRRPAIERKQRVVAALYERGAPVCQPFAARDGRLAIVRAGHVYSASSYVAGTIRTGGSPYTNGALLAAYHAIAVTVPRENAPALRSQALLEWLAAEFATLARSARPTGIDWPLARDCARRLERRFRLLDRARDEVLGWVHGDARRANIVIDGKSATFIDFDFLHYSEREYDVGTIIDDVAWSPDGTLNDSLLQNVLQGYGAEVKLTDAQRERVLPSIARRNLAMLWYINRRHPGLPGTPLTNARRCLTRCRSLVEMMAA